MTGTVDRQYMLRALELAAKGRGFTTPNPMVGAVVVKGRTVVGEGYHQKAGGPHAEIFALRHAGSRAKGATIYVTLEPCCHQGRTGPCTEAIIKAGITRVVYAVTDPDPRVSGRGAAALRKAGLAVTRGVEANGARRLNEIHFTYHELHRPFITVKSAQSLDGRIATPQGFSKWLTGEQARDESHRLRASHDAVLVGMGTVQTDNPSLTVRRVNGCTPYRIILSRSLEFPTGCKLLRENRDYRTIVASAGSALTKFSRTKLGRQAITWEIKTSKRTRLLDLNNFVDVAYAFGLRSLLVEGGSMTASSFFAERLVDKYVTFVAPKVLGNGVPVLCLPVKKQARRMEELIVPLRDVSYQVLGADIMCSGYLFWGKD